MTLDAFRAFCLSQRDVTEEFPFDEQTVVFKVLGKMFALADIHEFDSVNVKCEPGRAVELREQYECVQPGYHMNKKHWNTVVLDGSVADTLIFAWLLDSYNLVTAKQLKARKRK